MEIDALVYAALLNALEKESELSWVSPVFVPGYPCFETYCEMQAAYARLRKRLGTEEEDTDVEEMISCLLKHGKILAMEMFRYGRIYQQMQEDPVGADH